MGSCCKKKEKVEVKVEEVKEDKKVDESEYEEDESEIKGDSGNLEVDVNNKAEDISHLKVRSAANPQKLDDINNIDNSNRELISKGQNIHIINQDQSNKITIAKPNLSDIKLNTPNNKDKKDENKIDENIHMHDSLIIETNANEKDENELKEKFDKEDGNIDKLEDLINKKAEEGLSDIKSHITGKTGKDIEENNQIYPDINFTQGEDKQNYVLSENSKYLQDSIYSNTRNKQFEEEKEKEKEEMEIEKNALREHIEKLKLKQKMPVG